jgi:hypothetical protein
MMSLRSFLRRADTAVQDTKETVTATAIMAAAAVVIAVIALIVAVVKS